MGWFGKRNNEVSENEIPEIKPHENKEFCRTAMPEDKNKLDASEPTKRDEFLQRIKVPDGFSEKQRLNKHDTSDGNASGSAEGDPARGQRERERATETDLER